MLEIIAAFVLVVAIGIAVASANEVKSIRKRMAFLVSELMETTLALEGANNRLEQARRRAALLSNTDPVTGLLVRHVIVERFQLSLALANAQGSIFGVALVQLAEFEYLADQYGQVVADKLLTIVAERLRAATQQADTVGRVREHEFAMLVPVLRSPDEMQHVTADLRDRLLPPISIPGVKDQFRLTINVGSATYPRDGETWTTLLKTVDERLRTSRFQMT